MKKLAFILVAFCIMLLNQSIAQNVAITDDAGYSADPSAMLDVKSSTRGMLVPRLTTAQRDAISNPATGLLIFDTTVGSFYFYNGTSWLSLTSEGEIWTKNGNNVYTSDPAHKVGVGTAAPVGKFEVKADVSIGPEEPIFEVLNANGDTVFAVYPEGVRINVDDNPAKATGNRGGFAVGGFSGAKTYTHEFLRVTPDSVRIYIDDDYVPAKATGSRGGFAIGGFSGAKAMTDNYFFVQDDSSRIWTDGDGGFEILDLATNSTNYMDLTPNNYYIGHESGDLTTTGLYNSFFGYQAGKANESGNSNVFIGYQSGFSNDAQNNSIFIGYRSGYSTTYTAGADNNVYIGTESAFNSISGASNTFIGHQTGYSNTNGGQNVYVGYEAGYANTTSGANTYVGYRAGRNATQNENSFFGYNCAQVVSSGQYNSFFGSYAGGQQTSGSHNSYFGRHAGYYNAGGSSNSIFGSGAGYGRYTYSYSQNSLFGSEAAYNNTGSYNSIVGYQAGYGTLNSSSYQYSAILGFKAGLDLTTGNNNVLLGAYAGYNLTSGASNVIIGYQSGLNNITGASNVFIGNYAGYSETGSNKLYIDNSSTSAPLIYGDFSLNNLEFNVNKAQVNHGNDGTASGLGINNTATTNIWRIYQSSASNRLRLYYNTALRGEFDITTGAYTSVSDLALKKNIEDYPSVLDKVIELRPKKYHFQDQQDDEQKYSGFIAQEIKDLFPSLVRYDQEDDLYTVDYAGFSVIAIQAIKEQQAIIDEIREELDAIKNQIQSND